MTQAHSFPAVDLQDTNGLPYAGMKAYFYDPGTTTPRVVYQDAGLTIPHASPVVADAAGILPQIYMPSGTYKVRYETAGAVLIDEYDNVDPGQSTSAGALPVASGGTGATTAAGARTNLSVPSQAAFDALDTRVADVETILAAPILAASNTQAYAASFTGVFTTFETRDVTLTGNITIEAPTVTAGQKVRLILIQDATGGRTWSVNSAFKWPFGIVPALSVTASAVDVLEGYARTTAIIEVTSFKRQDVLTNIAIIEENQTSGTAGGTFSSGANRIRVLNTEVSDLSGLVTIASNNHQCGNL
jgi:hypothetical protein